LNPPPSRATIGKSGFPGAGRSATAPPDPVETDAMNGFAGYLVRTWLDRAGGRIFGVLSIILIFELALSLFFIAGAAYEGPRLERLLTQGLTAEATIDGVDVHRSRYGTTYKLNLSWSDAAGATRHQTIRLSEDFAPKIVAHGRAIKSPLPIKYLADDPNADVLPVGDIDHARDVSSMSFGITSFTTCVALFVGLFAVRRYVRRNHPDVPAAYTTWFKVNASGPKRPLNTFMRVFLKHSYFTIPALGVIIYALKWYGLFEPFEDLTGWTEYWIGLVVALLMVGIISISGWCYDRHVEWQAMQRAEGSTPAAPAS
jgi:hypothetical protein